MNPAAATIKKRCEWNRYCSSIAPFFPERLLEIGTNRPHLVGRCYHCEGFVCNRCASRRPHETGSGTGAFDAWELLCPLEGTPLGRGNDWIIFGGTAESICRSTGPPNDQLLSEAFSRGFVWRDDSPEATTILQLLEQAFRAYAADEHQAALDISSNLLGLLPNHVNALLMRRWALEKLHRFDEAWETLRTFLQASQDSLTRGLGELNALNSLDSQPRNTFSTEILSALKTAAPAANERLVRDAISKLIAEIAPDLAPPLSGPAEAEIMAAAQRPAAQPQTPESVAVSCHRSPNLEGAPMRELVTSIPADTLKQMLSALPQDSWQKEHWTQFVIQGRNTGALESVDAESFATCVWNLPRGPELAAWPLSAQMLVEMGQAVADKADLDLTGLFDLYAGECFCRSSRLRACFGESEDAFLAGGLAALESFRTEVSLSVDELARLLNETVPGHAPIEEWAVALREHIWACPMLMEFGREVAFGHNSFQEYFLARHLFRRLFQDEKPEFKLAGSSCFDLDTAIYLGELIARSDKHSMLLNEWLGMKRQRRSLFRGADVPTFVRNLALVRLMIKNDARSLDLTDADFSGLDLNHADFRNSILAGANFRSTNLGGARFGGCDLTGATFDGSDLDGAEIERT